MIAQRSDRLLVPVHHFATRLYRFSGPPSDGQAQPEDALGILFPYLHVE